MAGGEAHEASGSQKEEVPQLGEGSWEPARCWGGFSCGAQRPRSLAWAELEQTGGENREPSKEWDWGCGGQVETRTMSPAGSGTE